MWDNLHEKAMVDIVNELLPFGTTNSFFFTSSSSAIISRLSNAIGIKAREMSLLTEDYLSPFGMTGLAAGEFNRNNKAALAGKPDDITVIVSVAVPLNRNTIRPQQQQLQQHQREEEEEEDDEIVVKKPIPINILYPCGEDMIAVPEAVMDPQQQVEVQQHVIEDHHPVEDHPSAIVSPTAEADSIISPFPTAGPLFLLDLQVRVYLYLYIYILFAFYSPSIPSLLLMIFFMFFSSFASPVI